MRREPALALPEEAREESARWGEEDRGREREPRRASGERRQAPELPKFGDKERGFPVDVCVLFLFFFLFVLVCVIFFFF